MRVVTIIKVLLVKLVGLDHLDAIRKCYVIPLFSYRFLNLQQLVDHFLLYTHDLELTVRERVGILAL